MNNFLKQILQRHTALLVLAIFVGILGIKVFLTMPRSLFPEVNYPRVVVEVNMGYTPLQNMEWGITSILEKELRSVPGVRLVKSTSSRGLSTIDIFLNEDQEITSAVQRVNAKIAEARALIPAAAQISVRPITAAAFPSAEYCFTSKTKSTRDLRKFVEYTVKPQILVIPGIYNVNVIGGDTPEYSVMLDPKKMAAHNITVTEISDRLKNSNNVDFLGPVQGSESEVLAFGGKFAKNTDDLSSIVVDSNLGKQVTLRDLSKIELRDAWKTQQLTLSGQECVALDIFYQTNINQQTTSRAIKASIANIIDENKGDYTFRSWDLNDFTDTATNAVLIDLLVGMVIIGLVTFIFLKNLRYSAFALIVMPLAATFTFLAMKGLHLTINLMTLGGLTAAIGLVVDNTVIILEMYHHRKSLHPELSSSDILLAVLKSVIKPMIFGTLTIAFVFTPIGYLSGVSGMFFEPMASVHGSSLIISIILAILVVPGLILLFGKARHQLKHQDTLDADSNRYEGYTRLLKCLLEKPKMFALVLLVAPLLGLVTLPWAKSGFLPEWDEGDLVIDFRAESPMNLKATIQKLKPLEDYLNTVPEVDFFIRKIGTALGEANKPPYLGEFVVKLKKDRKKDVFTLRDQLNSQIGNLVKGFEFDLFQILPDRLNDLSGNSKPIVLYLHGDDEEALQKAADDYKEALSGIKGLDSLRIEEPEKSMEFIYSIDERKSRLLELNPSDINNDARFALFSIDSSTIQMGPQSIPVRLRIQDDYQRNNLADLPIYTNKGGLEKLGTLGKVEQSLARVESTHLDGNPVQVLTAEIAGRDLGSVVNDIQTVLKKLANKDITAELAGEYQNQQRSFHELILAFLTGLGIIFVMSLFFSNSLRTSLALTICALIPPTVGLVGLVVMQIPLDVSSFSGLISVTGIAVANSFMALSAIEELNKTHDFRYSLIEGMRHRIRPILMTNLAAMAGFIPIAIGLANGDEILRPFSIAIIAGLFGAIYTTILVMPLCYSVLKKEKRPA